MDTFEYKGRNKRGEVMHGTIESPNTQAVASWMLDSGISPIHIELHKDKKGRQPAWLLALQVGGPINIRERLLFTRQMCTICLLYTSPSPRDGLLSRMPSSA